MEKFIGILQGKGFIHRRAEQGIFEEAARCRCPYMIDLDMPILETIRQKELCAGMLGFVHPSINGGLIPDCPFPLINFSNTRGPLAGMGNVLSDDAAVGRLAAETLLKRGHRHFLAVGQTDRVFSRERQQSFLKTLQTAKAEVLQIDVEGSMPTTRWSSLSYMEEMWDQLAPLLEKLPSGCAIFGVSDWIAWPILRLLENKMPERLHTTAVLGVDNQHDSHFDPRKSAGLSSIVPAFRAVGARGLQLLLQHIHDPAAISTLIERIPPEGVAERASTAGAACDDPLTARLLRLIWTAIRNQETVDLFDLARRHGMSLRTLENKFNTHFSKSARDYVSQLRIDYGKTLLRESGLSVTEIAMSCGYADTAAFSNAFRRLTGTTPRGWRNDLPPS